MPAAVMPLLRHDTPPLRYDAEPLIAAMMRDDYGRCYAATPPPPDHHQHNDHVTYRRPPHFTSPDLPLPPPPPPSRPPPDAYRSRGSSGFFSFSTFLFIQQATLNASSCRDAEPLRAY